MYGQLPKGNGYLDMPKFKVNYLNGDFLPVVGIGIFIILVRQSINSVNICSYVPMKFRANYFLLLFVAVGVALLTMLSILFTWFTYKIWLDTSATIFLKILIPLLTLGFYIFLYVLPKIFIPKYYSIHLNHHEKLIIILYPLLFHRKLMKFQDIKGYSYSEYQNISGYGSIKKRCITLYLRSGEKIEILNHVFFGFSKLFDSFKRTQINYFGEEKYIINHGQRVYEF